MNAVEIEPRWGWQAFHGVSMIASAAWPAHDDPV
jgi:hypothetical protein